MFQREKSNHKRKIGFSLPPFFLFLALINSVHAEETIDLTNVPQWLATQLGIPEFAGGILAFILLMLMTVLPFAIIARGRKAGFIPELALSLGVMGLCIALEWLPYWFLLILGMLVALMFSGKMRDLITGGK